MHSKFLKISAALFFAAALFSCSFDAPESDKGSISMRLPDKSQLGAACENGVSRSVSSDGSLSAGSVDQFKVVVRNISSRESITQFVAPGSSVTVDELEPGSWDVAIFGYANDPQGSGQSIRYYGNARGIPVEGGETSNATVSLYDISGNMPGFGFNGASTVNVSYAYINYSCDDLSQSGDAFYSFNASDPSYDSAKPLQPPLPIFMEPGYAYKVTANLYSPMGECVFTGTAQGTVPAGGGLVEGTLNAPTDALQATGTLNGQYVIGNSFADFIQNYYSFNYGSLTIPCSNLSYKAINASACGLSVPYIASYGNSSYLIMPTVYHPVVVPTVSVSNQTVQKGQTITVSPSLNPPAPKAWPKLTQEAAVNGFSRYIVDMDSEHSDKDTWTEALACSDPNANKVEFNNNDKTLTGKADGSNNFTWTVTVTPGQFGETPAQNTATADFTATCVEASQPSGGNGNMPATYGDFVQKPFSVSATKQVYFSPGNLWYQATTNTYKFAEKQSDIVGESGNDSVAADYDGWIDQFPWGSSGFKEIHPYTRNYSETRDGKTIYETMHIPGMTGEYENFDWGVYNAISNGGNQAGLWRTLTSEEWNYLFNSRSGGPSKRAPARVNGIAGMVLLPDTWNNDSTPSGLEFNLTPPNSASSYQIWATNEYNALQWSQMEAQGAVFLPAAGSQYSVGSWEHCSHNNPDSSNDIYLKYWTATGPTDTSETKYCIKTTSGGYNSLSTTDNPSVSRPTPVRLCQNTSGYTQVTPISPNKIYVAATGGSDTDGDGTESHPYESLAQACKKIKSFAEAQDYTIFVDGNFATKQTMKDAALTSAYAKSITVKGKNGIDSSTNEPKDSIIGNGSSSSNTALYIEMPAPVIIKDLKITGGTDSGVKIGDGMNNNTYCDVTLGSGVLISGNRASSLGAGVYASPRSKLTIDGAIISNNTISSPTNSQGGSGIYFYGYEMVIKGDSKINENKGSYSSQPCPAIYCPFDSSKNSNCNITIEGNAEISKNEGMGLCLASVIGTLTIRGNAKITENENLSSNDVGGIRLVGNSSGTLNATISGNVQISGNKASTFAGIGVYYAAILNFEGGIISGNEAKTMGGGIGIYSGTVYMSGGEISGNKITNASSTNHGGGGVYIGHRATNPAEGKFYLTGGTIKENTVNSSGRGTGVYVIDTVCTGTNPNKSATFSMGGAAKVDSSNNVYIRRTESTPTIVIASDLTQTGSLATIMLESYSVGTPVLSGTLVKNYYTQFTLSDASTYSIDQSGALVSN